MSRPRGSHALGQRRPREIRWSGLGRVSEDLEEVKGHTLTSEGESEKENNVCRRPAMETCLVHTENRRKASLAGSRRTRRKW